MHSLTYTIFFVIFIAISSIQRVHETFFSKKECLKDIEKKETLTLSYLTLIHVSVVLATTLEYFYIQRKLNLLVGIIGLLMYLIALIVRQGSIKTLGPYHSYNIEIFQNHKLIRNGIYKYIRHPVYAVTVLEILGIPLVGNAYYSFGFGLIFYMPVLGIRTALEEKELIKKFGNEYIQYKQEVCGFLPLFKNIK